MSINKIILILSSFFLLMPTEAPQARFNLPALPSADQYGNILISRGSRNSEVKSVAFSHWSHRTKYTCKVCHMELEFEMIQNTTEITEEANKDGMYCGSCHDGKIAFGHTKEHCKKCHSGNVNFSNNKFKKLKDFPSSQYGNKIDWGKALDKGLITPKSFLKDDLAPIKFEKEFSLDAGWAMIPPAIFSHKKHVKWLDCSNCHPDIFNIKKKTTKHFSMVYILNGKFCGSCHGKVAFPINNCKRCHPGMRLY